MRQDMEEEMSREGWQKAIPQQRDRVQSALLVGVVGAILALLSFDTLRRAIPFAGHFPVFVFGTFGISAAFALAVLALRAATVGGALCGGMICLLTTFWTGSLTGSPARTGLTPLILLFLLTFLATRAGRQRKAIAGLAEGRRGRSAAQVIANLSVAGLCVSPHAGAWAIATIHSLTPGVSLTVASWAMKTMCLAALVEATADTVSSEIGQAFGGQPVMLTTLRRVAAGTDGAVTILGSAAGIAAGAIVAGAGSWAMHLEPRAAGIAFGAGFCGLFFDSLLGATIERGGWLGNDLVNFASTLFAAVLAAVACGRLGR
jgi:uncharacterized protein (TIGR00297 family)